MFSKDMPGSLATMNTEVRTATAAPMEKMKITHQQMNLILMAVEHGVRQTEKGNNLQAALASVFDLYEVTS